MSTSVSADEGAKAAAHMVDHLLDSKTTASEDSEDAPFSRAVGRKVDFWTYVHESGHEFRSKRVWGLLTSPRRRQLTRETYWPPLTTGAIS